MEAKLDSGLLDSKSYFKVLSLLRRHGIAYSDIGFGFERFYYSNGLYRVSNGRVSMVYSLGLYTPFRCEYLDCSECPPELRLKL